MISVVVPVYKNADNISPLLSALSTISAQTAGGMEAVFVVDGSPDDSYLRLSRELPSQPFCSQLLLLSRNWGSFSAIRAGLNAARGEYYAVMAADLQEPPELVLSFEQILRKEQCDIVVGVRTARADPPFTRFASSLFWALYRRWVQSEVPPGGVDIFACNRCVRDHMMALVESNSSLVGLLFWVGFRREFVGYQRRKREIGRSAWTFSKKLKYLSDSVYGFSDLPIRLLSRIGALGLVLSALATFAVIVAKLAGTIPVPGYAATVLSVLFFGALNCFGLGVLGNYVWRTFENTKARPSYIVARAEEFPKASQVA